MKRRKRNKKMYINYRCEFDDDQIERLEAENDVDYCIDRGGDYAGEWDYDYGETLDEAIDKAIAIMDEYPEVQIDIVIPSTAYCIGVVTFDNSIPRSERTDSGSDTQAEDCGFRKNLSGEDETQKEKQKKYITDKLNEKHDFYLESYGEVVIAARFVGTMTLREAMDAVEKTADEGDKLYVADTYDPLIDSGYTNIYEIDESACDGAYVLLHTKEDGWYWQPCYQTINDFWEIDYAADMIPYSLIA